MNKQYMYITKPERYIKYYEDGKIEYLKDPSKYVFAVCKCPLDLSFAICIPKIGTSASYYPFKCSECGTEGVVYTAGNY